MDHENLSRKLADGYQPRSQQHTGFGSIWPSLERPSVGIDPAMGGSTSDDASIFDGQCQQDYGNNNCRQSSESSASPPAANQAGNDTSITATETGQADGSTNPKQKRIACIICRKRKLKCDGARPTCSTCARLKHKCGYDETRKKSGPKRGYVKELEKRLKQIETQLESGTGSQERDRSPSFRAGLGATPFSNPRIGLNGGTLGRSSSLDPNGLGTQNFDPEHSDSFPWEMMSLGLEEPLPPQDMINELHAVYFEKLHASMPMIHKYRYLAAMNLAPSMRPPVALRYALWSYACSALDKYTSFQEMFYQRARKYAELDEMRGFGEQIFTVGHVQAWVIIANYEFKMLYFPRAWMSVGRAVRLAQMLGLYRLDGGGLEVKECLGKPKDWIDCEERRRTFWAAYCFDRWASIGTGWPMNIDERDIHTDLPTSEEAFEKGRQEKGLSLASILTGADPSKLSSYSSVILMASIIGKTLTHLHRTESRDDAHDEENGEFWKRHRYLDHILTNTTVCLPAHLRLAPHVNDPNVIFLHMNIHSVAICLHQAAILRAEQNNLGEKTIKTSTDRCYLAATEVANIWRMISHVDISFLSPYVAFCLFVAARVFVHAYKKRPNDSETRQSLHFLLNAMEAHRKRNDITESFLMQLLVDLDDMGFESVVLKRHQAFINNRKAHDVFQESSACAPVMQKHSSTQPSYAEIRRPQQTLNPQSNAQRVLYSQHDDPTLSMDSTGLDIPIRPAMPANDGQVSMDGHGMDSDQLHGVSLDQDYDLKVTFDPQVQFNPQQGASPSGNSFTVPNRPTPQPGNSPMSNGQTPNMASVPHPNVQGQFYNQGDFDMNLLNAHFDMSQDQMMSGYQNADWGNVGNNIPPNMPASYPDGSQSTPAAAWASFI